MQEEEESVAKLTDNASTLEEELAKTKVRNTMQSDPALEAFERLRVREVIAEGHDTASAFLAKFQSIAANLQPDERIKLVVYAYENSMELLKTVLSDPQANKICSLLWECDAKEDVTLVIPLLVNSCPELASLWVCFKHHSVLDFVSSLLEHPSNKLKVLERTGHAMGDFTRFFAALGQSQVSAIDVRGGESPEFARGLYKYLARDLLVRLKVTMHFERVPSEMVMSLADCTRLAKLEMLYCKFSPPVAFTLPKSITKLTLNDCRFVGGFDWSFLADSNVQELDFYSVRNVEGNQLGDALSAYLRAKGLDKLHLRDCDFANETLVVIGVNVGRIKRLMLEGDRVSDASIELIALALQSPNSEMKELVLSYSGEKASIKNHLLPALKHPNCNLIKLSLLASQEHSATAKTVEDMFYKRLALFVLLQGRQVKRRHCPLRRLPMEMFRLVGAALI